MLPSPRRLSGYQFAARWLALASLAGLASCMAGCKASDSGAGAGSGGAKSGASGGKTGSSSGGTSGGSSGGTTGSGGTSASSGGATATGSGGTTATGGTTTTGSGGDTATGGTTGTGTGGTTTADDAGVTDAACQMATVMFAPKIPNVLVLVDGSGTMFNAVMSGGTTSTTWDLLRAAALPIINSLQGQVNFGLGVFTGVVSQNMCPLLKTVPIAPNNYATINAQYPTTRLSDMKLETPVSQVLTMLPPLFKAATGNGNNYILFATDGEPDFCDDGNHVCPVDAAVAGMKSLYDQGITTYVLGLQSGSDPECPNSLQAYANAGSGQPIVNPCPGHNIYGECNSSPAAWMNLWTASGRPAGTPLADYVATGGTAKVFMPNVTDQSSLTNTLASLFNGVKSCTFDLGNLNGQSIKVDLNQLGMAHVCLGKTCPDTTEVVQDTTNGWSMGSATQLTLNGTACDKWRMPNNNDISFDFPCKSIIFEGGDIAPTRPGRK